jgi:hypothetical protein
VTKLQADLVTLAACVTIIVAATHWSNYRPDSAISSAATHAGVAGPIDTIRNANAAIADARELLDEARPLIPAFKAAAKVFADEANKGKGGGR